MFNDKIETKAKKAIRELGCKNGDDYSDKLSDGRIDAENVDDLLHDCANELGCSYDEFWVAFQRALSGVTIRRKVQ